MLLAFMPMAMMAQNAQTALTDAEAFLAQLREVGALVEEHA